MIWDLLRDWAGWLTAFSILTFFVSLWMVSWIIIRLPADHFVTEHDHGFPNNRMLYLVVLVTRNGVGVLLFASGVVMLISPGQGVITILIGLSLMTFPGRRKLINRLVQGPRIRKTMNWIRKKAHKPEFVFEEDQSH